jgi:hypothetical protein
MFKILTIIENRINNLKREKDTILKLIENKNTYEEDYLIDRLCKVNISINELNDLYDDLISEVQNEKEN